MKIEVLEVGQKYDQNSSAPNVKAKISIELNNLEIPSENFSEQYLEDYYVKIGKNIWSEIEKNLRVLNNEQ